MSGIGKIICGVLAAIAGWIIEEGFKSSKPNAERPRHCQWHQVCRVVQSGPCRRVDQFTVLCPREQRCKRWQVCA